MGLTRVATFRDVKKAAVLLVIGGDRVELSHGDLSIHNTAEAVGEVLSARAGLAGVVLPRVFVHVNRDGSLAVATGRVPKVWPEDEVDEREIKHD